MIRAYIKAFLKPVTRAVISGLKLNFHYYVNEADTRIASRNTAFSGTVIYVATNGNDTTGDGTVETPYKTITKAYSVSSNGGVIQLADGTYQTSDEANGYVLFNTTNRGILLRGNTSNRSAVVINQSGVASFMLRCRDCGEMRFEYLTLTTNQVSSCISKDTGGNLNVKIYRCDLINTCTSASSYCISINTNNIEAASHIEVDECNLTRNGNTHICLIIASTATQIALFKSCTFTSSSSFLYPNGNRGKIAIYDCLFTVNGNAVGIGFGTDADAPDTDIALIDLRNNTITYSTGYSQHGILVGRGSINVYIVNNRISMDGISNVLAIGMAVKSTASNIGECIIAGNLITAPRPIVIKGGQKNIIKWNTFKCNLLNNYSGLEIDNPVNPDGDKLSIENQVTYNNIFGQESSMMCYKSSSAEEVDVTIQGWLVDRNNYYSATTSWAKKMSTTIITWINKATLWNVATTNDANSRNVGSNNYIINNIRKDV